MKRVVLLVVAPLVAVTLLVVVIGLLAPREWHVRRDIIIRATPAQIHPYVEDLRRWRDWAAWNREDTTLAYAFSGAERGTGATQTWTSKNSGHGSLTITKSDPSSGIWFEERVETTEVNAHGSITYQHADGLTTVTWADDGRLPPVIGGFLREMIEDNLGAHFDIGLKKLKELVEGDRARAR